jgi:hypothetical protein
MNEENERMEDFTKTPTSHRQQYDSLKEYLGQSYSGMRVGGTHQWHYQDGIWIETKITPDQWEIDFKSKKRRFHQAPAQSGAQVGTDFHWFIIADQIASKINENMYNTNMYGVKFKIGYKKSNWQNFSYTYPSQLSYKDRVIKILESYLLALKQGRSLEFCFSPKDESDW